MKTFSQLPSEADRSLLDDLTPQFVFGAATAAYQIEGSVNVDGRGESIWDRFSHTPGKTVNAETGDVACDHYRRWEQDVDLMAEMSLEAYRFSIAWPRVQPRGEGAWNPLGLAFYDRLVDRLLEKGIAAHATLYHWDLPQALQDKGGWGNRDTTSRFAEYAAKVASVLGDRLSTLATHNEPFCTTTLGHETGKFAPGLRDPALAAQVSHHLLLSHGLAINAMRAVSPRASLGIVLNQSPCTPASLNPNDVRRAATEYAKMVRWYMEPLFLGSYLQCSDIEHYPSVEPGDMQIISAPIDFLGINYYTRIWASTSTPPIPSPNLLGVNDMGWETYPDGLAQLLLSHQQTYRLPPIYICENGMACADRIVDGLVDDGARIDYVRGHLAAIAKARRAGVDIRGYFYWSFMDNYEWDSGYGKRFGIVHVDYPTQTRTVKRSGHWYSNLIATKQQCDLESVGEAGL
jgi:beta-glucosidase